MKGLLAFALGLLMSFASPIAAQAERVYVRSESGEVGHGWLFGSAWDGEVACWLAVPRHVTLDAGGQPAPFTYTDASGRSTESGVPVAVDDVEGAVAAAGGITDLAFARPANNATGCTSRLGVPDYTYTGLLQTVSQMQVWSMSPRSYGPFWVTLDRAQAGEAGGKLRLKAVDAAAAEYLISGISGGVATAERAGEVIPFAMIVEVDADSGSALALRFDRIKAAFGLVEASAKRAALDASIAREGIAYVIDGFKGIARTGGPSVLMASEGCWEVLPEGGQRTVDLLVHLDARAERTRGLTLAAGACGAPGVRVLVEQQAAGASAWTPAIECVVAAAISETPDCRLDLRTPRSFRIRVIATGAVGLSQLRFY